MRFAIVAFLVVGVLATSAAIDLSAPSRTRVPAIEVRPAPLPEVSGPVVPTVPKKSRKPAQPPAQKPRTTPKAGAETPALTPASPATSSASAGSQTTDGASASSSGSTSGESPDAEEGPRAVWPAQPVEPTSTAKRKRAPISGAIPAPPPRPVPAEGDHDDDDDDHDDDR